MQTRFKVFCNPESFQIVFYRNGFTSKVVGGKEAEDTIDSLLKSKNEENPKDVE